MISLLGKQNKPTAMRHKGLRPVNLRTDLAPLANLIELTFADSMDSNGRAALREMRYLSKMGPGLPLLSRMNTMATGINLGFVWITDGKLVGNVSIYPTTFPRDMGRHWIIANVGVHPNHQRRGIARQLMQASMEMIQDKGGSAILQVDIDNHSARELYRSLGFIEERAWTSWRRAGSSIQVPPLETDVHVRRRYRSEWQDELALAQQVCPQARGGLGWLRPTHRTEFHRSFLQQIGDWLNLRTAERLVIRPSEENILGASLKVASSVGGSTRLTLLVNPHFRSFYDRIMLNTAVRRFGRTSMTIEHPHDDAIVTQILEEYHFKPQRTVIHMRWDA